MTKSPQWLGSLGSISDHICRRVIAVGRRLRTRSVHSLVLWSVTAWSRRKGHGAAKQPWQQQGVYSRARLGRIQGAFCDINVLFKYILELPIPQDLRSEDPTVGGWICYPIPARSDKGKGSNCPPGTKQRAWGFSSFTDNSHPSFELNDMNNRF